MPGLNWLVCSAPTDEVGSPGTIFPELIGRNGVPLLVHPVTVVNLFFLDTCHALFGSFHVPFVGLGGAAEVEALLSVLLLLMQSVVQQRLDDIVTLVLILNARRHVATVLFCSRVLHDGHLLASQPVHLILQPDLEFA